MGTLPLKGSTFEIICSDQYSVYFLETWEVETLSIICMQDRICLFSLTLVSSLLYCIMLQELHKKMTGHKSQGNFKSP